VLQLGGSDGSPGPHLNLGRRVPAIIRTMSHEAVKITHE